MAAQPKIPSFMPEEIVAALKPAYDARVEGEATWQDEVTGINLDTARLVGQSQYIQCWIMIRGTRYTRWMVKVIKKINQFQIPPLLPSDCDVINKRRAANNHPTINPRGTKGPQMSFTRYARFDDRKGEKPDPATECALWEAMFLLGEARKNILLRFLRNQDIATRQAATIGGFTPKVIVASDKVVEIVQTIVTSTGLPIPNGIFRASLKFNDDGTPKFPPVYYEMGEDGKPKGVAQVEGKPINTTNIHAWVTPGSANTGLMNIDSVCCSNMGMSSPSKMELQLTKPAANNKFSLAEGLAALGITMPDAEEAAAAAPGAVAAAAAVAATAGAAADSGAADLEGLGNDAMF